MIISRVSLLTGVTHTRDIPVTREQLIDWDRGALIQDAMPNLTPDEREFIETGITNEEWEAMTDEFLDSI